MKGSFSTGQGSQWEEEEEEEDEEEEEEEEEEIILYFMIKLYIKNYSHSVTL
jgi:hypothetical protein